MRIYTRTGDDGTTGTLGLGRRSKADLLIHALGELDELNAALGFCDEGSITKIQSRLLDLGAEVASLSQDSRYQVNSLESDLQQLESSIDEMEPGLPPLANFIVPGGSAVACHLHLARAICRRAERTLVELRAAEPTLRLESVKYLNRLADWLFVRARYQNELDGVGDTIWEKQ